MIKLIIKLSVLLTVIVLNICKTNNSNSKDYDSSTLETPYLGQKPPGLTLKPFTPDLVSTDLYEVNSAFTPDMKAFYFISRGEEHKKSAFYEYKYYENSRNWEKPEIASPWIGRLVIAPDGKTVYLDDNYLKRTESGWSELQKLAPLTVCNDSIYMMRLSAFANGRYFFDTYKENDRSFPIRYSRLIDGKHEEPKALPKTINTGIFLSHPFIAPDESYLLVDAEKDIMFPGKKND